MNFWRLWGQGRENNWLIEGSVNFVFKYGSYLSMDLFFIFPFFVFSIHIHSFWSNASARSFLHKKRKKKDFYTSSVHVVRSAVLWRTWKASVGLPMGSFDSVSALFWPCSGFLTGEKATVACPLTSTGSLSSGHRVSPKQAGPDRTSISPSKALETAGTFSQMGFRRIHSHSRCYNIVAWSLCPTSGWSKYTISTTVFENRYFIAHL